MPFQKKVQQLIKYILQPLIRQPQHKYMLWPLIGWPQQNDILKYSLNRTIIDTFSMIDPVNFTHKYTTIYTVNAFMRWASTREIRLIYSETRIQIANSKNILVSTWFMKNIDPNRLLSEPYYTLEFPSQQK